MEQSIEKVLQVHTKKYREVCNRCSASVRAVGYQYCNICCFYRYDVGSMHNGVGDEIKGFEKYVAVIKNETEFIRSVVTYSFNNSFKYVFTLS